MQYRVAENNRRNNTVSFSCKLLLYCESVYTYMYVRHVSTIDQSISLLAIFVCLSSVLFRKKFRIIYYYNLECRT